MRFSTSGRLACLAVAAAAAWPTAAQAAPPPLTADFTATDVSTSNHQWYATGTTTTVATIATTGTVTFNYLTGVPATTRHSVSFGTGPQPTTCTPAIAAGGTPSPPARAPWTASCRFDTPGTYSFVCQIHSSMRGMVNVVGTSSADGLGGAVPATLALGVGPGANLGNFVLGVARDYTATLEAVVTSTAADATLTANDPNAATGYLVNGSFVMAQALQIKATNAANPATLFAPVTSPVTLLTWGGPVSNDPVSIVFKQPVGTTDPLRSGTYAKTLMFTLSTSNP